MTRFNGGPTPGLGLGHSLVECRHRAPRSPTEWRPFVGSLSARSAAYALSVIGVMYRWLSQQRYVLANPFAGIKVLGGSRDSGHVHGNEAYYHNAFANYDYARRAAANRSSRRCCCACGCRARR